MANTPVNLDEVEFETLLNQNNHDIEKITRVESTKHGPIPSFLTKGKVIPMKEQKEQTESERVLEGAARLASNENYALYGDQVKFNNAVCGLVNWMSEHKSSSMGEATFSELVQFARQFTKVIKGTVHNSQSYLEAAASLGIAAECAAKEDKTTRI